ncbi:YMGG-like glycine zipper-containing protein [Zavarzinia compransoris]|nr:YMGG-like glycine zipper-containing protein [Zavarzinia compransoris]TDP44988.1 YmgG-like glycine-zipper protein [Zavarzinia compransoris]
MVRRQRKTALRLGGTLVLVAALGLGGCVSNSYSFGGGDYYEPLTPAQAALREQTDRFNETVATGAVAGALLGALVGALADSRNPGRGAAIGAAAGGVLGGASGYYIASENEQYASREQALEARIQAARNEAASYRQIAASSSKVAAENRRKLAQLEQQYRNGQISARDYKARTAAMHEDLRLMDEALSNAGEVRQKIYDDSGYAGPQGRASLGQSNADIARSAEEIARSRDELARALATVPDA